MQFKIDSDVKVPSGRKCKYPFDSMEVGDSFSITKELITKVRWSASQYGKSHGMKFITRIHGDGARCWRVE